MRGGHVCVGNEGLEDGSEMQLSPRSGQEAVICGHSSSYQPHFSGFSQAPDRCDQKPRHCLAEQVVLGHVHSLSLRERGHTHLLECTQ